ncbi:zinc finger domain-containing protein [Mycolicibacterium septicum]|uniref:DNA-binding phage zinc finger domain-containing protein n=2 Tax=Mycolicibacterium septicum TaxID=98668 RepID=A0ABW9LMU2_9MYCO
MPRSGREVRGAYEDTGAGAVECPNCHAAPGNWCETPEGRRRRVPCVARLAAAPIAPVIDLPDNARAPVDFGEPRHAREGDTP